MRVAYVLNKFPKLSETFILHEMLELERQGVEVVVYALGLPDEGKFHRAVCQLRAPVHYVGAGKSSELAAALVQHQPMLRERSEAIFDALFATLAHGDRDAFKRCRWALEVAILANLHQVDRLHAHFANTSAQVARDAAAIAGIPYGFTCHAKDIYHEAVDRQRLARTLDDADLVVTVCKENQRFLEEEVVGRVCPQLHVIYNGVDLERFCPTEPGSARASAGPVGDNSGHILAVGRLVEKKGFGYLVEAMAELRRRGVEAPCRIVGGGREFAQLQARVDELALRNVHLMGALPQEEVQRLLAGASMVVQPCVIGEDGNRDALPTVLLEALASGVPVVTTSVVGIDEIVANGDAGVLVPERDSLALAEAMGELLSNPARREDLARKGRQRAEDQFDLRKNVATLRAAFADAMASSDGLRAMA